MFRLILLALFTFSFLFSVSAQTTQKVEMADLMRADGKIYVVVATLLVILLGFFWYLWQTDRKITKLEKELKD
ncbi:MAG: CcmD family protein [Bacteroidetes bacterium]|nr:MAG: CcmD family protein [Bacteroidota bacterium]TAG88019.1 MAG: CcmD family protein [Bacteroidota bacterium]